jgi:hypothetical protein
MAVKFNVSYSEEKDISNYLNALWKSPWTDYGKSHYEIGKKYLSIEYLDSLKNAPSKIKAVKIIKNYWKNTRSSTFTNDIELLSKWFGNILNEEGGTRIIKTLENAYQRKFPFKQINVYLTTLFSCPYNYEEKWFMVGRNSSLLWLLSTSLHELNHFMFYYYFNQNLENQGFSQSQREHLKEALAILTSDDSKENQEKPQVLPIQNFIKENKDKSIDKIIELVLEYKLLENIK